MTRKSAAKFTDWHSPIDNIERTEAKNRFVQRMKGY